MYLEYAQYENMGGTLDETAYARYELKARRLIDRATHSRIAQETPVRDSVKYCMFELINTMYAQESMDAISAGREISAMSNDGVSISFAGTNTSESGVQMSVSRYLRTVRMWLDGENTSDGVPLLYAGVDA